MRTIRGIYRYPIKGLSPQAIPSVELEAGKPFPLDRVFALARPGAPIDPVEPRWAKKGLFVMLMLDEALARVRTRLDTDTLRLTIQWQDPEHGKENALVADLATEEGREAFERFVCDLVPRLKALPRLVHARDGHFMDKPNPVISCINLATVRSLEQQWGYAINPLRFRANFYIDGATPWEELDWVGHDIVLGDVVFHVASRNGRCGATNVDPDTGARDLDIPGSLRNSFGHKDLGVYLLAHASGKVVVGDAVTSPTAVASSDAAPASAAPSPGQRSFMCRGCYYVYDEARGAPGIAAGTPFAAIAPDWRCPDCGTDRGKFRLHIAGV